MIRLNNFYHVSDFSNHQSEIDRLIELICKTFLLRLKGTQFLYSYHEYDDKTIIYVCYTIVFLVKFLLIKILNMETTQRGHLIFVSERKIKANKVLLCSETNSVSREIPTKYNSKYGNNKT